MEIKVSPEVLLREEQQRKAEEKGIALSERIASLVASADVTVDVAERALRRAETIVRTRTIVNFSHP